MSADKKGSPVVRINPEVKQKIEEDMDIPKMHNNYELNTFSAKISYLYNFFKENNKK